MIDFGERFSRCIRAIDEANAQDPRRERFQGQEGPRELLFVQRVWDWVLKLVASPSEELLLAARGHTVRRWEVPRDRYPMTNPGYHEWRDACAEHHARVAEGILTSCGYPRETISRVLGLIRKVKWQTDPEGRALEDADCLAFLEMKLAAYLDEWDPDKTVVILRRTVRKMTPEALTLAAQLPLDPRCAELLRRAQS